MAEKYLPLSVTPSAVALRPKDDDGHSRVGDAMPIPARMLNEFVYCPRLFYYEFVEGLFEHSADTLRGQAAHKRVDAGKGAMPAAEKTKEKDTKDKGEADAEPETIHARSVWLASDRLGVSAKIDLVEITDPDADLFTRRRACPVDYKSGSPRETEEGKEIWDTDRMQLGLQALILRDNGYACEEGIIFYRGTRQRIRLLISPELEEWVVAKIEKAGKVARGPIPPPLVDSPKCPRCSLVNICMPDETRLLATAPDHPDDEDDEAAENQIVFAYDYDFPAQKRTRATELSRSRTTARPRLPHLRDALSQRATTSAPSTSIPMASSFGAGAMSWKCGKTSKPWPKCVSTTCITWPSLDPSK